MNYLLFQSNPPPVSLLHYVIAKQTLPAILDPYKYSVLLQIQCSLTNTVFSHTASESSKIACATETCGSFSTGLL